ncbi:MAG: ATPase [FCB group bacterium]|nr:ATPase [FCB group bacterium]
MKTLKHLSKVLAVVLLGTLFVFAAKPTVEFEVKGACGMCETRIEKTAKDINGVKKADWTLENNMLMLKFDDKKTSVVEVRKALAAVGHDNGNFRAPDDVYENLPACCHYERDEAKASVDCASGNCGDQKSAMQKKHEKHTGMMVKEKSECSGGSCSEKEKAACEREKNKTK